MVKKHLANLLLAARQRADEFVPWLRERPLVQVSGLQGGEKAFQESMVGECEKYLTKFKRELPSVQAISVYVKGWTHGGKKLFQVKGTLFLNGGELFAGATDRDLSSALARVLYEFEKEVERLQGFKQDKYVPRRLRKKAEALKGKFGK